MAFRRRLGHQKPDFPRLNRSHRLAKDLRLAYAWAEGAGAVTKDLVGNNFGTVHADGWGRGKFGRGMKCVDAYYTISSGAILPLSSGPRTVSVWAYPTASDTGIDVLWSVGNGTVDEHGMQLISNLQTAGELYLSMGNDDFYTAAGALPANIWSHVVWVYDGGGSSTSTHHCYVNGIEKSLTKVGVLSTPDTDDTQFWFGASYGSPTNIFRGYIDMGFLWARALTPNEVFELYANPLALYVSPVRRKIQSSTVAVPAAALTGTIASGTTEAHIVTGGRTLILTLTNDTWVTAGGTFDGQRANIIAGIDSAQAEATGWDAVVKVGGLAVGDVVRTSNTVVTITLPAVATYNITATETITATIPATALTAAGAVVATPTFTVTQTAMTAKPAYYYAQMARSN